MKIIPAGFTNCKDSPTKIISELRESGLNEFGFRPNYRAESFILGTSEQENKKLLFQKIREESSRAIIIGGDQSIIEPIIKAVHPKNKNTGIIIVDPKTHCHKDGIIRRLVESGFLNPKNVILMGTQFWTGDEREFIEYHKIRIFSMRKISINGISEIIDTITENAREIDAIHISVSLSSVDPSAAPGVTKLFPGGISARELIYSIQRLKLLKNWNTADLRDVNTNKDINGMTVKLASKVVLELS